MRGPLSDRLNPRLGEAGPLLRVRRGHRPTRRRTWVSAVAALVLGGALAAQGVPIKSPIRIPLATGARRFPKLEVQPPGSTGEYFLYRWEAPMELLAKYYIGKMGGDRDGVLDSTSLRPGGFSGVSYHMTFYDMYDDQCTDSIPPGADTAALCKHWRRAKDLRWALTERLGISPGVYLQRVVWIWYGRDKDGVLTRWTAELFDQGIGSDWKSYRVVTQLTVRSDLLKGL